MNSFNFYSKLFFISHNFDDIHFEKKKIDFFQRMISPFENRTLHQKIVLCYG